MPRAIPTHEKPFVPMQKIVPAGKLGRVEVKHFTITEAEARFAMLRAAIGHPDEAVLAGDYVGLYVGHTLMMSDTQHEQRTSRAFVEAATGDVLIAGLGLGMVVVPLLKKPQVKSIVVVEKEPEVVALVGPYVATDHRVLLCVGDIHKWSPPRGTKYDTIFFDIWANVCLDNLSDMNRLHHRFQRYLRPGGWMDSWKRRDLVRGRYR